jgi:Xaa-Pro aminopeptidase
LATDGRYFNQAEQQLDSNWELLKQGLQDVPTIQEWTADQVQAGAVVGVDPSVVTAADARKLADKLKKKGAEYKAVSENLVDVVWGKGRPERPSENVIMQPVQYAGKSFEDKLVDLRKDLERRKSLGFVVSMLDEVAWLYNLRGNECVEF